MGLPARRAYTRATARAPFPYAHVRIPHARGAMPVHEREPVYTRVERGVPRISIITNLDYNAISKTYSINLRGRPKGPQTRFGYVLAH